MDMRVGNVEVEWSRVRSWAADLVVLPILGVTVYLLFRAARALRPLEAAVLVMVVATLVLLGRRWAAWQRNLAPERLLSDWAGRILRGDRAPLALPAGVKPEVAQVAKALNALLEEGRRTEEGLEALHRAALREWNELDGLLGQIQERAKADRAARAEAGTRLAAFGRDIRETVEDSLKIDQLELEHRLRAGQVCIQGDALSSAMEQTHARLAKVEALLADLQGTFPRLREEEEALGRLAGAGGRQGARLSLAVKGLVDHLPRFTGEAKARADQQQRFRTAADELRDQAGALVRRIEAFRAEARDRAAFGNAQGAIRAIDQVAQQTGLLAVNTAILAHQGSGAVGMQAIGGRLRGLADQTAQGAADLERVLDEHQQVLAQEDAGLRDLLEATERLGAGLQELLRVAGQLDQQGRDLEGVLEAHLALVDQVRQASERTERSLREVGERSTGLQAALGRQWSVASKASVEVDQLARTGRRAAEVGRELARVSLGHITDIGGILDGHQKLRRSEAYGQVASGELARLLGPEEGPDLTWNRVAWARLQRHQRLLGWSGRSRPLGRPDPAGGLRLLLLGRDALGRPEPSALSEWSCDPEGRTWRLALTEGLQTESHRHALQEVLREGPLPACLPGTEVRVTSEGVDLRLPFAYPGLPLFLAGLGLELPVEASAWRAPVREAGPRQATLQRLLWCGPGMDPTQRESLIRLVHAWVRDDPQHEHFMPWLPYDGRRPPCPLVGIGDPGEGLEGSPRVRCLALDAAPDTLRPFQERLIQAGAQEGEGGAVLAAIGLGQDHPEALLLRLFQAGAGLAEGGRSELTALQRRFQIEVLSGHSPDPYQAAWRLLEELQRKGWVLPLPSA